MLHAGIAGALAVIVVAVAYGTAAPQLAVAEFAPAARQALEAPPTTAAESAASGAARRRPTTTQPPASATTMPPEAGGAAVPTSIASRGRPCHGDPPRQLPDPRSPSCVAAIFDGDNGGATSMGVTATEVRVATPHHSSATAADRAAISAVFEYFNRNFELYGRRLVPTFMVEPAGDPVTQRAFASGIGTQSFFAAVDSTTSTWLPTYYHELARLGVIAVSAGTPYLLSDREHFDELHPYLWSVFPSAEQSWRNLASFVCGSLVGRPARHAGPSLRDKQRTFGVVVAGNLRAPSPRVLLDGLGECGVQPQVVEWLQARDSAAQRTTALNKLKDAGVTTLLCVCTDYHSLYMPQAAKSIPWLDPEWVGPVFSDPTPMEEAWMQSFFTPEQRSHTFGLQHLPKAAPIQTQWWLAAARELAPDTKIDNRFAAVVYDQLLVLAAGIQAAGPNLSPQTFAAGLQSTSFPNSEAGQAPHWSASVGFGPGDHSFVNDYALVWWEATVDPVGPGANPTGGSWCYLDRGARFHAGTFPADADDRFFDPARGCR